MGLLVSFLYLLLHIAVILLIAYIVLWVVRDWFGVTIEANVMKFARIVVALLVLIAVVVWLSGAIGYSDYRLPLTRW